MSSPIKKKTRSIRFKPEKLQSVVKICLDSEKSKDEFNTDLYVLLHDEAHRGCCFVTTQQKHFKVGELLYIKIEPMHPLLAEIKWVKILENEVAKVGLQYLE